MAKYCLKKPSKRLACAKRHKVEKKVREHNRKVRKAAKSKVKGGKKDVQLINVPNKCPFKEEVLAEAEKRRSQIKDEKQQKKLASKSISKDQKLKKKTLIALENPSTDLIQKKGIPSYVVNDAELKSAPVDASVNKNVKAFSVEVRKTIESADVVFEMSNLTNLGEKMSELVIQKIVDNWLQLYFSVLDARDPLGCRSRKLENLVLSQGKRLVLLLNKIDLVPKENVIEWLAYFRNQLPTIAFKASTQDQNQKLGRYISSNLNSASSKCIGADLVMKLLGNYCRNKDIKTSIRVGIVGFPNVGKSSVINSLKRKKACNAGSVPGLTRQMQEIELDKHIRLIDSPGVVLATRDDEFDATELALRNALRVESLEDPTLAVNAILRRCAVKVLMLHYTIPEFNSCEQFLALMARRFGRLKKGGRPDVNAAAKQILNDWNSGKLRYHTKPPEEDASNKSEILSSEILSSFSKEFDLDALEGDIKTLIDAVPESNMVVETVYDSSRPVGNDEITLEDESDEGEMEHDDADETTKNPSRTVVTGGRVEKKRAKLMAKLEKSVPALPDSMDIDGGNAQLNRAIQTALKKHKKQKKKLASRADKLADSLSNSNTLGENNENMDYDFGVLEE